MEKTAPSPGSRAASPLLFIAVFLAATGASMILAFVLPEVFCGVARVKLPVPADQRGRNYESVVRTGFEVIRSETVLNRVITNLQLNIEWGKRNNGGTPLTTQETLKVLRKSLDIRPVPNARLVEIRAYRPRPDEAAAIANAVTKAFADYRREQNVERMRAALKETEERWNDMEQQIKTAQSEVTRLRIELRVPQPEPPESELAASYRPYVDARRHLNELLMMRAALEAKIPSVKPGASKAQADLMMISDPPPEILDVAVPSPEPVRPRKALIISIGAIIGLALGGIAAGGARSVARLFGRARPLPK